MQQADLPTQCLADGKRTLKETGAHYVYSI